jgi:uncharacterized membrane protein
MPSATSSPSRLRTALRVVLALAMIAVGVLHFLLPAPFVRMTPAWLPAPLLLVYVSGVFEILGGAGLLVPATRKAAAWGLIALYIAVFPANVNMAIHHISLTDGPPPPAFALWLRLPFQALLIAWAYWLAIEDRDRQGGASRAPARSA